MLLSIVIGSDHGGYTLKEKIKNHIVNNTIYNVTDVGCHSIDSCDYPDIAEKLSEHIIDNKAIKGILICGSGIGISIAANKIKGIRCALCYDTYGAQMCRKHNDANVVAIGGRTTEENKAIEIVNVFLKEQFEGGRHKRRVDKITGLEFK